jgi:N-methylhydantoinase B
LQKDVLDLILLNCQVPRERLSDLRAQMAANRLGVERFQSLCAKYGVAGVLAAGEALLDYAERKMRAALASMPAGSYRFEDVFDQVEIEDDLTVSVEITIAGNTMKLQFESPPQVRAGVNMTYTALLATVYYAVKSVVDPTILPNAGLARPLTVTAPAGTLLNCVHPAAVNGRVQTCQRVCDLILGALAQAAPERVTACTNSACTVATFVGEQPSDGSIWVYLETMGGGGGARPHKDGLDGVHVHTTNTSNLPVEALEVEYPLTLMRYELVEGSGGPGRFRGGMGLRRVYRAEAPCRVRVDLTRLRSVSWGLLRGLPGTSSGIVCGPGVVFENANAVLQKGQWFEIITPGGGGYGPPAQRSLSAIARDLAEGVIDAPTARSVYGLSS